MTFEKFAATAALSIALSLTAAATIGAWQASVNGRATSDADDGLAVALDPHTGSVFVAGTKQVTASESAFMVVKFSATGDKEWQHVLRGERSVATAATALAIDSNGFLFAAGYLVNAGSTDLVLIKLDGRSPHKRLLWARTIAGFGSSVNAIRVTPDGGLALAGGVDAGNGTTNFYLMKFTADGQNAWASPQILSGTASTGFNTASAIGILSNGDMAVAGTLVNAGTNYDGVIGRFDGATGARRWLVSFNDPLANGDDFAGAALAVAPNDDIVAIGSVFRSNVGGFRNFAVFRLNGQGTVVWTKIIDRGFSDQARTVAVAPNGDVIAGGTLEPSSGPNGSIFFVVSLGGPDGVERWRYENPGVSHFLEARDIAFDGGGNPVVTGSGPAPDALSAFVVLALDKVDGSVLWNVPVAGTAPLSNEGRAIVSDPAANVVVAVGVTQNERTSFDLTVAHITGGQADWRQAITGRGKRLDRTDAAVAVATDSRNGSLALAGYAQNTGVGLVGTPHDFTIVKVRKNGTTAWKYDFGDPLPHLNNSALAVVVSASGDVLAAGRTCSVQMSCFTVVRVDTRGKEVWRTIVPGAAPGSGEARALVLDPRDGNVIAAGIAGSTFAVVKLDSNNGDVLWSSPMDGSLRGTVNAMVLTSRGTVVAAGSAGVVEFNSLDGTVVSTGIPGFTATSMAFDAREGTVVVGGAVSFSPFPGDVAMAVAKLDATGTVLWSFVGPRRSGVTSLAIDRDTGAIAAAGGSAAGAPTVLRLDAEGAEQWRRTDIAGSVTGVSFASNRLVAAGRASAGSRSLFAAFAFADDGTQSWQRTFPGTAGFGTDSASALVVDEARGAIYAAGVVTNTPTGPDMFAVALTLDGNDFPDPDPTISVD